MDNQASKMHPFRASPRISERELRFPDSFSSILTMAFKILLLGMNHGLISSQFHLRMTIKFGSVGKKTVPKSQERQKNSKIRMFCIFFSVDGIIASIVV